MIAITPIPAFNDNYLWLLDNGSEAAVVDPGDAAPVEEYLERHSLTLSAILITHHHGDHTGGIKHLKNRFNCPVYGPAKECIPNIDYPLNQTDSVTIDALNLKLCIIEVPGHTAGHIAYFAPRTEINDNLLFCGDTVFSGGCGRLFEGTAAQMWDSMQKLMQLPDDTLVFPAHEYTLANLEFALAVEPDNQALHDYQTNVIEKRQDNRPSLPTNIGQEKAINPFMRVRESDIAAAALKLAGRSDLKESEVFAQIRQWKDNF